MQTSIRKIRASSERCEIYPMPFLTGPPFYKAKICAGDLRILLAHTHAALIVPLKRFFHFGQWRIGNLSDGDAVFPVCRTDRDEASIAAQSATKFRKADGDQATLFRHLIQIRNAFRLGITVMQQPVFTLKIRCGVGIKRLMTMKKNMALLMEKFKRFQ